MKASTDGCFLKRKGKVEGLKMEKYGVTGNVNNALSIMLQPVSYTHLTLPTIVGV